MRNDRNAHSFLPEAQKSTATLEARLAVSDKVKDSLNTRSIRSFQIEKPWARKNLHWNVYRSFIHTHQKLVTIKMSFDGWMDEQTVAHPYDGILFSGKKRNELSSP